MDVRPTALHTTLSSSITVHYRFHPLAGTELQVVRVGRRAEMPITVRGPDGVDLKIPRWMTDPSAGDLVLSDTATLAVAALRAVTELVATHERLTLSAAGIPEHPRSQITSDQEDAP